MDDLQQWPVHLVKQKQIKFDYLYDRIMGFAQTKIQTEAGLEAFLKSWWCIRYNRPYRDPLLQSYTLEELIVEYLDVSYRSNPDGFKKVQAEAVSKQDDDNWADKMAEKYGEKLLPIEEQRKHEAEIEEAFEKHAEENEVEDLLTMGSGVHHKFNLEK